MTAVLERQTELEGLCHALQDWMFLKALPFWATTGRDGEQGFVECLDLAGRPHSVGFKRTRVHARQIYVFSHAHTLGYGRGLEAARGGLDFLLAHGWAPHGGWVVSMGETGGIVNEEIDLYDQAFVLLAFAWWMRASGSRDVLPWIDRTLEIIDERLLRVGPDGQADGWNSRGPHDKVLLQNPHMHLLEALLALYAMVPGIGIRRRIAQIIRLFETRFFDPVSGSLGEYYDEGWGRITSEQGHLVEPGHHFEWYWLLRRAEPVIGRYLREPAERLYSFARQYGVDQKTGYIHDVLTSNGSIHNDHHRSWPQTEYIKAMLGRADATGQLEQDELERALRVLQHDYLDPAPEGCWIDHLDASGKACVSAIPASTLYHLFLATAELMRLQHVWRTPDLRGEAYHEH
ncbi:mannose-6-phosphate isomerase [Rhizobium sp. NFR07]|uniref:AGE family epimerase/isomerase n=1 Tax=Rhizobium sp. NFR07 TaxID=1566262 RepID=UPI0008E21DCB|nr:AGE family epimerase/isomerase [Rhizobium sp. NFR07]SFA79047.1 mannose-6-phosphate isomerase [Rhizobium sp. NFR07]